MKLLLVRHGEPREREANPGLTDDGKEMVRRRGAWCKDNLVSVEQIRHSEKKRAAESAQIMAEHLSPPHGVLEVQGLTPYDDVEALADALQQEQHNVMYVGHLPFLFELVNLLLEGKPGCGISKFGPANIVCLSRENGKWTVEWTMPPELMACWKQESFPAQPEAEH